MINAKKIFTMILILRQSTILSEDISIYPELCKVYSIQDVFLDHNKWLLTIYRLKIYDL